MHIGKMLKSIIEEQKLQKNVVAKEVGVSPTYLSGIMNKDSIDCELLGKFCKVLNVSPALFFDGYRASIDGITHDTPNIEVMQIEISMLRKLVEEKERMIQTLLTMYDMGQKRDGNE